MEKDLLRLIYQRRFKLMNQWHAGTLTYQPKFGGISDLTFRSFIFKAFEKLFQAIRPEKKNDRPARALLHQFDFPKAPEATTYRRTLETGIKVMDQFFRQDPACRERFTQAAREAACMDLRRAGAAFLETEMAPWAPKKEAEQTAGTYCLYCGRLIVGPADFTARQ